MDIITLKTELADDPLERGYAGMNDQDAATDLNTVYRTRNRTSMTGRKMAAEIVNVEYDALTEAKKAQILALIASDDINPFGFAANVVKDVFEAESMTVAALVVARTEDVSRATELGLGIIHEGTVEQARTI